MSEILEDIVVDVSKMETTTPTRAKSSAVGNSAAMREALFGVMSIRLFRKNFPEWKGDKE